MLTKRTVGLRPGLKEVNRKISEDPNVLNRQPMDRHSPAILSRINAQFPETAEGPTFNATLHRIAGPGTRFVAYEK